MPNFVTSIFTISIKNSSILVSFAFGPTESKQLYNKHFENFQLKFSVDISKYSFESDQGTALLAFFEKHKIKHFACMKHLSTSLKFSKVSFAFSTIIKCCSLFELNNAMLFYSHMTDIKEIQLRNKLL